MKTLALIPARGGSKGIRRKNIRPLCGQPLIAYAIHAALASGVVTRTIVSTDDAEIGRIAAGMGADVPFRRPDNLATDETPDFPVVAHCLEYLSAAEGWVPDLLVFLRPTLPLRQSDEIAAAVAIMASHPAVDTVRTTRPVPYPPFWMKRHDENGYLQPFTDAVSPYQFKRRQDLPEVVMGDGYVDVTRVGALLLHRQIVCGNVYSLYREGLPFVDLDTPEDWDYCEYLLEKRKAPHDPAR